jgi:hypothetical protein
MRLPQAWRPRHRPGLVAGPGNHAATCPRVADATQFGDGAGIAEVLDHLTDRIEFEISLVAGLAQP